MGHVTGVTKKEWKMGLTFVHPSCTLIHVPPTERGTRALTTEASAEPPVGAVPLVSQRAHQGMTLTSCAPPP